MPKLETFRAVQTYAMQCSMRRAREKGAVPPYLWAAMELAYQARLRGIEVLTLTDVHVMGNQLMTNRRKGSRDNLVRKGIRLSKAIEALRKNGSWFTCFVSRRLVPDHLTSLFASDTSLREVNLTPLFCISGALLSCAQRHGIRVEHIQPGKPQQNAYVERYNRTIRYA